MNVSSQNASNGTAETKQLTLEKAVGATASAITPTTKKKTEFEFGAIAFYWSDDRTLLYPCQVFRWRLNDSLNRVYWVSRAGLWFWIPADRLLSGWETDFPSWDLVNWTGFKPAPDEYPSEEEEKYEEHMMEFEEQWELDYYSDLAEQYEATEAA